MSELEELAQAIATTIEDYRADEIEPRTAEHVVRWAAQFDDAIRLVLLREVNHVVGRTYFSRAWVEAFLPSR